MPESIGGRPGGSSGGRALPWAFADTGDADYQVLLRDIARMADRLQTLELLRHARFPAERAVRPRDEARYGILPPSFNLAKDAIDVYKTDEA